MPARPAPPPPPPAAPAITTGVALVDAMHARYDGRWYRTITFTERATVSLSSGGQVVQTWHESGSLPGRLRIDTDAASKSGVLYARDSSYSFAGGRLVNAAAKLNEQLVLGFDVYTQLPVRTIAQLRGLGFDLSRMHETTWKGESVYVVGALRGDSTSKQFWVDRDRLLFVRMIERTSQGRTDTHFNDYRRVGDGWLAAEVVQYVNGRRRLLEEYTDIRSDVLLSSVMFDPKAWR